MAVIIMLLLCAKVFFIQKTLVLSQVNKDNFGPYKPHWDVFEACKGPKSGDCGKYEISDSTNISDVVFTFDFEKECPVTAARVTISSLQQNNKTKKLFNYALDKPCQHFVLGPILTSSFNLNSNCKIDKGHYDIHVNMYDKSTMFLGPSFFYGTYEFKIVAHNKVNNFFCVHSIMSVLKKT